MSAFQSSRVPPFLRYVLRPLLDPYRRYRHAKLIHATRVALGVLVSIALTTGIDIPHGEWATISLLIVIGGLQHHGNIRRRSVERAFGTLIGAVVGLLILVQQAHLGHLWLTWVLMAIACGVAAYYAIGKGGYIALLSAITLLIVAGHGDNELADGLWRAVNVLIGIVIALLFSFALPLYATWSWRYKLSEALRGCATVYARLLADPYDTSAEHGKLIAQQRALLVQLRSLMPSVSSEVDIPNSQLDAIQRNLQICISTLELLPAMLPPGSVDAEALAAVLPPGMSRSIRDMLIGAARALKQGSVAQLRPRGTRLGEAAALPASAGLEAYALLTAQLRGHVDELRERLLDTAKSWNI